MGLGSISLVFDTPIPGYNTTLNITFTLLQDFSPNKLNADNSSIFLRLPGFTFNSTAIAWQQKIAAFQACCPSQALYVYGADALGPQVGVSRPHHPLNPLPLPLTHPLLLNPLLTHSLTSPLSPPLL